MVNEIEKLQEAKQAIRELEAVVQTTPFKDGDKPSEFLYSDLLIRANNAINGQKNKEYGYAWDQYAVIAEFFKLYTGIELKRSEVGYFLIALKNSRMHKDRPYSEDTLLDLCGYTAIQNHIIQREQEEKEKVQTEC